MAATQTIKIVSSADDAMELGNGTRQYTNINVNVWRRPSLDVGYRAGGFRFPGLTVPPGSTIRSATLRAYVNAPATSADDIDCTIYGHATDNSPSFAANPYILSTTEPNGRFRTSANVLVTRTNMLDGQEDFDVTSIVQELVNRAGWASGNAIALLLIPQFGPTTGGTTDFHAWDGVPAYAAELLLDFTYCPPITVTQGADKYTVTIAGSCEAVFDATAGGGIKEFYDLEEDPTRTYDLAGGTTVAELVNQRITTSSAPAGEYMTGANSSTVDFAKAQILEATPVRVRVRSESFLQQSASTTILPGLKAVRDWTLLPSGRMAYGFKLRKTNSTSYTLTNRKYELAVHYQTSGPLSTWTTGVRGTTLAWGGSTGFGGQDYIFAISDPGTTGLKTDFVMTQAYPIPTSVNTIVANKDDTDESGWVAWNDTASGFSPLPTPSAPYSTDPGQAWTGMVWLKPADLRDDSETFYRVTADFNGPDTLTFSRGSGWYDTAENTSSPSDQFNDAEGAYLFDLSPTTGLAFDIDWHSFYSRPRRTPAFKIRGWRSLTTTPTVTLEGVPLVSGTDYKAAVKPFARAHQTSTVVWHSTLEDANSVNPASTLDVGSAGGVVNTPAFAAARYGSGALMNSSFQINAAGGVSGFNGGAGAVEFWYQPYYSHTAATNNVLWRATWTSGTAKCLVLWHDSSGNLSFRSSDGGTSCTGGTSFTATATSAQYSWSAYDWVHIRADWSTTTKLRVFVNEKNVATSAGFNVLTGTASTTTFGSCTTGCPVSGNPGGILDEATLYVGAGSSTSGNPDPVGFAGLTGTVDSRSWTLDTLADPSTNRSLGFSPAGNGREGYHLLLGADSKFRGLNVMLATPGAGTGIDLQWQYWNGTAWANLETVSGFGDTTSSLTRSGNVYWTSDPSNWSPYSVNGGPDLYYVRVYMPSTSSSYTTTPIESQIRTDILLFQYCGDITASAQTFDLQAPIPTAVKLSSLTATGRDTAISVEWETASELDNLGFHLYRAASSDGPWTRLNATMIPGLGSSPEGKLYQYVDSGLSNDTTYFYRLEDVDRRGRVTSHGPVSATPQAGAVPGEGGGGSGGGGGGGGGGGEGGGGPAEPPPSPKTTPKASWKPHGEPETQSLRILERSPSGVTLELVTGGFYSQEQPDGTSKLIVPGFFDRSEPGRPTVPTRRLWLDALVGRGVKLVSITPSDLVSFSGLSVPLAGKPLAVATPEGTYEASTLPVSPAEARRARAKDAASAGSAFPASFARMHQTAFQGERKKAYVELAPLRVNETTGRVVLARRLLVRLAFTGTVDGEHGKGSLGRRAPVPVASDTTADAAPQVLARFATRTRGLHAVAFSAIPGLTGSVATSSLRLSRLGASVPFHVEPRTASFGPGSVLYFLSEGTDSAYADEAVYELSLGAGGLPMPVAVASARRVTTTTPLTTLRHEGSFEADLNYLPALTEARDVWVWDAGLAGGQGQDYPFSAQSPSLVPETARLRVDLEGGSDTLVDPDHHVLAFVNGSLVGDLRFDGMRPATFEADVPTSLLRDGANTLRLENAGDTGSTASFVYLDRFSLEYPRPLTPTAGVLEGRASQAGRASLEAAPGSILLDTTGSTPVFLGRALAGGRLAWNAEANHRYLAAFPEALLEPEVRPAPADSLRATTNQADWIVLAPEALLPAAEDLAAHREAQGLAARAVSLEAVVDEFGFGESGPHAVRDFLAFAFHRWQAPSPRYVLLLGDASYDPKGHLVGTSRPDLIPSLFTKSTFLWTPADPLYAAVNGTDSLPDIAIGRINAATLAEAQVAVQKILDFENTGLSLSGKATLVADNPDQAGDFEANQDEIATLLPSRPVDKLFLTQLGTTATKAAVRSAFDAGLSLMSYVGHGSSGLWATEGILRSPDVAAFAPQPRQPLVLTMTCSNGYFVSPYGNSLSERLVLAEQKGAIASFSPSGLSLNDAAHVYHRAVVSELELGSHERLGDLLLAAQASYAASGAFPELLDFYNLLGDPGLTIR